MLIKQFEGINMSDALRKVKKEFGAQAIILSTQEKNLEGNLGKMIEIKAALPEAPKIEGARALETSSATSLQMIQSRMNAIDLKLSDLEKSSVTKSQWMSLDHRMREMMLVLSDELRKMKGSSTIQDNFHQERLGHDSIESLSKDILPIKQGLELASVNQVFISEILKYLMTIERDQDEIEAYSGSIEKWYRSHVMKFMIKRIKISPSFNVTKGQSFPSIHLFVGAPGSGKSSLMFKIASYLKKQKNLQVSLASIGINPFSSSDSIRVFSQMMGINAVVAENADDFLNKISSLIPSDVLLIDGISLSAHHQNELMKIKEKILSHYPVDVHLVSSLSDKEDLIDARIRHFSSLGIKSICFSRLDETLSFGEIYNICLKWSIPLSFLSTGPSVPEDLEPAKREKIVERIVTSI